MHVGLTFSILVNMGKIHAQPKHGFKGGKYVLIRRLFPQIMNAYILTVDILCINEGRLS